MFDRIKKVFSKKEGNVVSINSVNSELEKNVKSEINEKCNNEFGGSNVEFQKQILNLSYSIYEFSLSERTYNALLKNGIQTMEDFFPYKDDIRKLMYLRGLGNKAISELDENFKRYKGYQNYSLEGLFLNKTIENNIGESDVSIKKGPFFVYGGLKYYIYSPCYMLFCDLRIRNAIKKANLSFFDLIHTSKEVLNSIKGLGKSGISKVLDLKYEILRELNISEKDLKYVEFEKIDQIDFYSLISTFYSNLTEIEKSIINSRMNRFSQGSSDILSLHELGIKFGITTERVRQVEKYLDEEFNRYVSFHSDLLNFYLINNLPLYKDIEYFFYDDLVSLNQFSCEFLSRIFSNIFLKRYYFHFNLHSCVFFFVKDSIFISRDQIKRLFEIIDKKCLAKRTTIKYLKIKNIISLLGFDDDLNSEKEQFLIYLIEVYIKTCYEFEVQNGIIELSINKRKFEAIVIDELSHLDNPIHFTELYELLSNKYPQFKRREQTVHSQLLGSDNAVNVGKGLYIHVKKRPFLKNLKTSEDVIVKFLSEKENKRATISEIIYFVKQYKDVDTGSIESVLNMNKYGNFVKINNKEFGLKGYW